MKDIGFTLIECLVALFIIAIVLASSIRTIGLSVNDMQQVYIRQIANWAAENQTNQFLMEKIYPDLGKTTKNVTLGGISFIIQSNVSSTPNPYFRRIEISVSEQKAPARTIFKTTTFISQF